MCQLASHLEYNGGVLFLNDDDLKTRRGRELRKHLGSQFHNDVKGHGAIRWFYKLERHEGVEKECSDFSSPDNFPSEIVETIKQGKFKEFGVCIGILTQSALEEYDKIERASYKEYRKIERASYKEYRKIQRPASEEYGKIKRAAWEEYNKIKRAALEEYDKIERAAFWKLAKNKKNRKKEWR